MSALQEVLLAAGGTGVISGGLGAYLTYKGGRQDSLSKRVQRLESRCDNLEAEVSVQRILASRAVMYTRSLLSKTLPFVHLWGPVPIPPSELVEQLDDLLIGGDDE